MNFTYKDLQENVANIREVIGDFKPEITLILGSGLGFIGESIENPMYYDFRNSSFVHQTSAPGHKNRLVFGTLEGKNVVCMQGRLHFYEGYSMQELSYMVRTTKLLGAEKMIITNAAGCINRDWKQGDIMVIEDHIKFTANSPLIGENMEELGPRFCDMSYAYNPEYRDMAEKKAKELGITLRSGVYIYFAGPQYETPAEIRAARILGADAVGMSTVPEVITASHCGMKVLGFSLLSNMAAGVLNQKLTSEEVNETAELSAPRFERLIRACIKDM